MVTVIAEASDARSHSDEGGREPAGVCKMMGKGSPVRKRAMRSSTLSRWTCVSMPPVPPMPQDSAGERCGATSGAAGGVVYFRQGRLQVV